MTMPTSEPPAMRRGQDHPAPSGAAGRGEERRPGDARGFLKMGYLHVSDNLFFLKFRPRQGSGQKISVMIAFPPGKGQGKYSEGDTDVTVGAPRLSGYGGKRDVAPGNRS